MDYRKTLTKYYYLSKPGIIYANVITAVAGYLLASRFGIDYPVAVGLLAGLALIIAGACAANNYMDRHIDAHMERTKRRSVVTGSISGRAALGYAATMTLAGGSLVLLTQNRLTALLAAIAWIDYVFVYGYAKRHTVHSTLVGCVSGSLSLVAGYTAVVGHMDATAWALFFLMVAWQMGHFYGIALYRRNDYAAAGIPVMPVRYGGATTKLQTIGYIGLFIAMGVVMTAAQLVSIYAGLVLVVLGLVWLVRSLLSYRQLPSDLWGKRVFLFSLLVMLGMSSALALGRLGLAG